MLFEALKSENIYSPQIFMVDSPVVGFGGFNEDGSLVNTVTTEAVNNIIDSVTTSLTPSAVLDFFNIRLSADGDYVTVSPILGKSEGRALILRYNTGSGVFHVIIEVVPNAIEGITVTPSEDTPPYATHEVEVEGGKETHHIYSAGDTVLLAGKGHETYQILGTEKIHYDEREIVRDILAGKTGNERSETHGSNQPE